MCDGPALPWRHRSAPPCHHRLIPPLFSGLPAAHTSFLWAEGCHKANNRESSLGTDRCAACSTDQLRSNRSYRYETSQREMMTGLTTPQGT